MKKYILFYAVLFTLIFSPLLWNEGEIPAQPLDMFSDGAIISVYSDSVIIDGNFIHQGNDTIVNAGNIYLTGNWTNNNDSSMVFTNGPDGWLHLSGVTQTISGTRRTHFNNLELSGTGIKQLNNIDAEIEDVLALNDREFAAGDNDVLVLNSGTGAVTRTNVITGGFVSSTNNGGLSRNTASTNAYSYPVGSSNGTLRYRPVDLFPASASANTFKVRMANVNPTAESYGINILDSAALCFINANYYHRIYHSSGTDAADISIYYDAVADGNFQTIAHWQGQPRWENTLNNTTTPGTPLSYITKSAWSDFSTNPFALAGMDPIPVITADDTTVFCAGGSVGLDAGNGYAGYLWSNGETSQTINVNSGGNYSVTVTDAAGCKGATQSATAITVNPAPVVTASPDDTIILGSSDTLVATGAVSYQWQPGNGNNNTFIVGPAEETTYTVIGTDSNGCADTATVIIYIDSKCVYWLPNIFSPNGDAQNDELKIYGRGLESISLVIYDRWGNKVHESTDVNDIWDGKYQGGLLNTGVYVYTLNGKCLSNGEEFEQHGNVTLTR